MKTVFVFDIDGTISDDTKRLHLLNEGLFDEYHAQLHLDEPVKSEWDAALQSIKDQRNARMLCLTGRPDSLSNVTIEWLKQHDFIEVRDDVWFVKGTLVQFGLIMRNDECDCATSQMKVEAGLEIVKRLQPDMLLFIDNDERNLDAFRRMGWFAITPGDLRAHLDRTEHVSAASVLEQMAKTYEARNKVYGDNFKSVAPIMKILFPEGLPPEVLHDPSWHLFELLVVKLTRFANSKLTHKDSIHDAAVYAAMIEANIEQK